MSNVNDFVIKKGTLVEYRGTGSVVRIPDGVEIVGKHAFENNTTAKHIIVPEGVTKIEYCAFRSSNVEEVEIPSTVIAYGNDVFYWCYKLKKLICHSPLPKNACNSLVHNQQLQILCAPGTPIDYFRVNKQLAPAIVGCFMFENEYKDGAEKKEYERLAKDNLRFVLPLIFTYDLVKLLDVCIKDKKISVRDWETDYFSPAQECGARQCVAYLMDWKNTHISKRQQENANQREIDRDPFNASDMKKLWTSVALEDGTVAIHGYRGDSKEVIVPERIGKKTVSTISAEAFYPYKAARPTKNGQVLRDMKSITIPAGVKVIEESAFRNCGHLVSISLPNGLESIGVAAFESCSSLTGITLPANVKSIGEKAFYGCGDLAHIDVPEGVSRIEKQTFYGCGISGITLPETTKSIDSEAFGGCSNLTSIRLPASVAEVNSTAFFGCKNLSQIDVAEENENYRSIDGVLYTKDGKVLLRFAEGREEVSFAIPEGVEEIGDHAFACCEKLRNIIFPKSLVKIGACAFQGCVSLQDIASMETASVIERAAFKNCTSLQRIALSDSLVKWGEGAFEGCKSLKKISIPQGVQQIAPSSFSGCTKLIDVDMPDSVTCIGNFAFSHCLSLEKIRIPDGVNEIGWDAFCYCSSLSEINLPSGLEKIESGMFSRCSSLTEVRLPHGIRSIGRTAFYECSSLANIELPSSLVEIDELAFCECTSLVKIRIPASVTRMEYCAFGACLSLSIVCEAEGQPSGWSYKWNETGCPIKWGS